MRLIEQAQEKETEEYAFKMWLAKYPHMDKSNFVSFNQFYDEIKPKKVELDNRSHDDIMQEVLEIENKFRGEG